MTESLEHRVGADPTEERLAAGEQPLESGTPAGEDLDQAQEAKDLDQDPDAVPNRIQEPEPPTPERVGPWDDESLED
jgi:hypothetical protein